MRWLVFTVWFLSSTLCFGRGISVESSSNEDVLRIARSYKDGGKYNWNGSGTPDAIVFSGQTILPKGEGTYCSGFTFTVAMRAAVERGLLTNKKVDQIQKFQREWYGATKRTAEVQAGLAMKNLGIGRSVKFDYAQPGDFLQLWRTKKNSGHSVVFLGWIIEKGKKIGVRYRSTQESTNGIGDRVEYFSDASGHEGEVVRNRTYFARLNPEKIGDAGSAK
jgi:hypothetical protein